MSKLVIKDSCDGVIAKYDLEEIVEVQCRRIFSGVVCDSELFTFIGFDKPYVKADGCILVLIRGNETVPYHIEVFPASNYCMQYELDLISK